MQENFKNSQIEQFSIQQIHDISNSNAKPSNETHEIINLLKEVNNSELCAQAISKLSQISEDQYSFVTPHIYYLIWSTPVFKIQVGLINSILENSSKGFHALLLHHVVLNFHKISTDRKDKFFYFLKKAFTVMSFSYILNIQNLEVLGFLLEQIKSKDIFQDWSDILFIDFISNCKPFLLESIQDIKIDENLVRPNLDKAKNPKNRDALYKLFK